MSAPASDRLHEIQEATAVPLRDEGPLGLPEEPLADSPEGRDLEEGPFSHDILRDWIYPLDEEGTWPDPTIFCGP